MNPKDYVKNALTTESNNYEEIWPRVTPDMTRLLHAAMGLQTESAEFSDALKKHLFYGKPLDLTNLREELFDMTWYMAIALDVLGYSFEEGFAKNIEKLKARYPNKFESEKALNRDLDTERAILESKKR